MRSWAVWYRNLVIAWVVLGLPSLVIGYGFSGGDFELPPADADVASAAMWLFAVLFILSPVLLWHWRRHGRREGF